MTIREAIVAAAQSWIGTPFHHGARVRGAGVDCIQLVADVYESVGLVRNVHIPKYPHDWMLHRSDDRLLDGITRYAVKVAEPLPGDLVVFRVGRSSGAHVGIVEAWPLIIHADTDVGVQRVNVLASPALSVRMAGWWSIVTAARAHAVELNTAIAAGAL